jgi:hypothetical protein
MSLNKQALTNYYNFAVKNQPQEKCAKCGEVMKGWAKSKCSVCNRFFCQSHMTPYLGPNKKCPDCWERLQSLKNIDAVPAAFQQANELYVQNNEGAKELENKLFASIFGPNNLIKFAAEKQEEENAETPIDPNTDTDVSVPTQETPEELEQPVEQPTEQTTDQPEQPTQEQQPDQMQQAEMQLTSLLDMIAQDIMAQINANPEEEFSEEEIMQMFQEKMAKLQSS